MHEQIARVQQIDSGFGSAVLGLEQTSRPALLGRMADRRLTWFPQLGVGYYPVECGTEPYDQDYFDNFDRNAHTNIGRSLMTARCKFVEEHYRGRLVDV